MKANQVVCKDCDYFMVGPNQAQPGPVCVYDPPEPRIINVNAGGVQAQQIVSVYPTILESDKQYCHNGVKFAPISLGSPKVPFDPPKQNPDIPVKDMQQEMKKASDGNADNPPATDNKNP